MRSRMFFSLALAILGVTSDRSGLAQTYYSAQERHLPFAIGTGISNFDLDYGKDRGGERRMEGITMWLDWGPPRLPGLLKGLSLEIEGRDINYGRPSSLKRMRQDTIDGGVVYSFPVYRVVHPYAQYLLGMGSIDFPSKKPTYTHDTRAISAPGAGLEVKVFRNVWVRGAYEYQFWPHHFGPHALNPNGFTFGAAYDFRDSIDDCII
jgi:hypothetical protein